MAGHARFDVHDPRRQPRPAERLPRRSRSHYAATRNTDRGRDRIPTTSALSPYLRRRLLTEEEVARAAVDAYGNRGAEKFVSEIFWPTYFKGHLETHPEAWTGYLRDVNEARGRLAAEPGLRPTYDRAVEGRTGIDGFDDWAVQLVEEGWLHNYTRMWFASVWMFTLRLPWELGADFFMRHLLDGDPASNTLSWRWVAGLHTRGKRLRRLRREHPAIHGRALRPGWPGRIPGSSPSLVDWVAGADAER